MLTVFMIIKQKYLCKHHDNTSSPSSPPKTSLNLISYEEDLTHTHTCIKFKVLQNAQAKYTITLLQHFSLTHEKNTNDDPYQLNSHNLNAHHVRIVHKLPNTPPQSPNKSKPESTPRRLDQYESIYLVS